MTDAALAGVEVDGLTVRFGGKTGGRRASRWPRHSGGSPASSGRTAPARRRPSTPAAAWSAVRRHGAALRPGRARGRRPPPGPGSGSAARSSASSCAPSLTVRENVALGREALAAAGNLLASARSPPRRHGRGCGKQAAAGAERLRHHRPRRPAGRRPLRRAAAPRRAGPGPRRRLPAAAARRAVVGSRPGRDRPVRRHRSAASWPSSGAGDPPRRARHEPRHGGVRLPLRARLRPADLRGDAGRDAASAASSGPPTSATTRRSEVACVMLELDGITAGYGDSDRAPRTSTCVVPDGVGRRAARPQRRRARRRCCAWRPGCCRPTAGPRPARRRGRDRLAAAAARRPRAVPRPRGARRLPAADRRPRTCGSSCRPGVEEERGRPGRRRLPDARAAARPGGGHAERRRAADAGPRPRLRRRSRGSCCSTRCRWGSPRSSSTRSSSSCDRLAARGRRRCCSSSSTWPRPSRSPTTSTCSTAAALPSSANRPSSTAPASPPTTSGLTPLRPSLWRLRRSGGGLTPLRPSFWRLRRSVGGQRRNEIAGEHLAALVIRGIAEGLCRC